jgi:hypothetical protein
MRGGGAGGTARTGGTGTVRAIADDARGGGALSRLTGITVSQIGQLTSVTDAGGANE